MAAPSLDRVAPRSGPLPGEVPHCFLVGFPRSGLTLLRRILNAHGGLAVTPEVDWVTRHYETRTSLSLGGPVASEQAFKWAEQGWFGDFGVSREQVKQLLPPGEQLPWPGFLARLFGLYAEVTGKPLVGCRTSRYLRFLPELHRVWPGARFVHLIRDGRDACLSLLDRHDTAQLPPWAEDAALAAARFPTWGEDPLSTVAFWWKQRTHLGREAGSGLGAGCYYELRYEALVGRPEEACRGLCAFLGLPYDPGMLRFHEGRGRSGPDAKNAWLPITPGLRDWRSQMPAGDVERFEAAAGGLLDDLGYPRACPRHAPEAQAYFTSLREAFGRNVSSLGDWLP